MWCSWPGSSPELSAAQAKLAGGVSWAETRGLHLSPPAPGSLYTPPRVLWGHVSSPKGKPTPSAFLTNTATCTPPRGWFGVFLFYFFFFFNATKEMIQNEWCFAPGHGFNTWITGSSLLSRRKPKGANSHHVCQASACTLRGSGQLHSPLDFSAACRWPAPCSQFENPLFIAALCGPSHRPHVRACGLWGLAGRGTQRNAGPTGIG